ncbi:MAG: hypothetical protein AAF750_04085 [Planctomycetota bacterium]
MPHTTIPKPHRGLTRAAVLFCTFALAACNTTPPLTEQPPSSPKPFGIPVLAIEGTTVTLYGDNRDLAPGTTLQLIQAELFDGELFEAPIGTVRITNPQLDSGLATGELTLTGGSLVPDALRFCIPLRADEAAAP